MTPIKFETEDAKTETIATFAAPLSSDGNYISVIISFSIIFYSNYGLRVVEQKFPKHVFGKAQS